jgi:hypothetical protein
LKCVVILAKYKKYKWYLLHMMHEIDCETALRGGTRKVQLRKGSVPVLGQGLKKKNPAEKGKFLAARLEQLVQHLEVMRITEYLEMLQNPKRLIWTNFIAGVARGLGMAIGATVVFALVIEALRRFVLINMFGIGSFITDIMNIIDTHK